MISHWDDVPSRRRERGHLASRWSDPAGEATRTVGALRIRIDAGTWSTPLHLEGAEEEIFCVLAGSGVSVQLEGGETRAYAVGAGDCVVHRALDRSWSRAAAAGPPEVGELSPRPANIASVADLDPDGED